jgi:hypothetical protein
LELLFSRVAVRLNFLPLSFWGGVYSFSLAPHPRRLEA